MKTEITLKRIETFEAFSGEVSLGIFKVESKWEDMVKLKNDQSEIIVDEMGLSAFSDAFGLDRKAKIIKASPNIFDKLIK